MAVVEGGGVLLFGILVVMVAVKGCIRVSPQLLSPDGGEGKDMCVSLSFSWC